VRGFPGTPGKQIRFAVLGTALVALACGAGWILSRPAETEVVAAAPPIKVSSDRLDFGSMAPGDVVERLLVVRNEGAEPLRVRFVLEGTAFRVDRDEMILHPGIDSRVQIAAHSDEASSLEDRLEILLDGAAPVTVLLTGRAGVELAEAARTQQVETAERPVRSSEAMPDPTDRQQPAVAFAIEEPAPAIEADAPTVVAPATAAATTAAQAAAAPPKPRPVANRMVASAGGSDRRHPERVGNELLVLPFDPATSVPIRTLGEEARPRIASESISDDERANARRIQSEHGDGDLASQIREDEESDIFDREREQDEPTMKGPVLEIYPNSLVTIAGYGNTFYPQEIGLVGSEAGGGLGLAQPIQFPTVFMSFGQSVLPSQQGAVVGTWDPASGNVDLQMPVAFVDSDGDAAMVQIALTTRTAFARDASGDVIALSGTPRQPGSNLVRLVALAKMPRGPMMLDGFVAQVEILARLDFSTSVSSSPSLRSDLRGN